MRKILIAVPCMDQVPAPFMQSIAMLRKGKNECAIAVQSGSLIYTSRNELAKKAIQNESDYVMWLDSDMVFPPDTMIRMLEIMDENDIDFLTGLYFRRQPPFTPVIFDQLEVHEDGQGVDHHNFETIPEERIKVAGCGFGCVLMKTDVLFDVASKYGGMFSPFAGMGEDLAFCWRARSLGYDIWCDPKIECGHVGYSVINRSFFGAYSNAHKQKEDAESV